MENKKFNYELFFHLSPDLLCIAGFDGYFKKINPAVSAVLGYTEEELLARPVNDFVYGEDKIATERVREELRRSKPLYNFENRYLTKTGEIVWLSWTSFPVPEDKLVFAVAKNITHKKKLEAERNVHLANLTMANKDLKQLSFTTSHDLRSPVNNLLSLLDMIDVFRVADPETLELLEILKLSGSRLKQTLNNYVDNLSEQHRLHARVEETDLSECLHEVVQSIRSLIDTSKATVHTDFSRLNKIMFNRTYLKSIFLNLITNSIKYARPDVFPVISISSEKTDDTVKLVISDNGRGFDMAKVKDRIFGLHQKFHDHNESKGIGLYLVYSHVTDLGGQITVESGVNEGAKFTITVRT
ncbi:MAG TPA: PAS domain-containing sensor histidine kinase [Bacteroidia bacterium]|nr:PAS domain-containing sensor histidine kinase [Bacteroidia bacterium]